MDATSAGAGKPLGALEDASTMLEASEHLTQIGGWQWNIADDVFTCSPGWLRIHGCRTPPRSLGEFEAITHPDDRPAVRAAFQAAVAGSQPFDLQQRVVRRDDGEVRMVHAYAQVKRAPDGTPVKLVGATHDVTELVRLNEQRQVLEVADTFADPAGGMLPLRQAEARQRENEEHLASIVQAALDAIITVDESYRILQFNAAAEKMFQCSAEEALAGSLDRFIPQPARALHRRHVAEFGAAPITSRPMGETRHVYGVRANGDEFPVEASISQVEVRAQRLCTVSLRDITERKQATEALAESERRFAMAVAASDEGIWEWPDLEVPRFWWSARFYSLIGYRSDEIEPTMDSFMDLLHPDDRQWIPQRMADQMAAPEPFESEYRLRLKSGEYRWFSARGQVTRDEAGQTLGMIGSIRDINRRKEAELALRESEAFNIAVLNSLSPHFAILDQDGNIVRVNHAWAQFAKDNGGNALAMHPIGWNYRQVCEAATGTCRDEALAAWAGIEQVLNGARDTFHLDYRCSSPDDQRWFRMSVYPLKAGRTGVVVAHQDITTSTLLAQTLRAERERLANIIDGTDVGTWEWHVPSGTVIVNERWAAIVGYSLAELAPVAIGTWRRLAHPDDLALSDALLAAHFAGTSPAYDCACRMRHKEGHWVWVRDRGKVMTWSTDGEPLQMFGTHLDISHEKLAEQALRESSQFSAQVIAGAQEGIVVYGTDLRYQVWNPYMEAFCGRKADAVLGRLPLDVFPYLQETGVFAAVERALAGAVPAALEFPFHNPHSGRSGWASDLTAPLRDSQGKIIGAIASVRDITEVKQAEAALREMNERLEARVEQRTRQLANATQTAEAANRAKSAFLANMSHEIRTPMTAILGMAELLKLEGLTARQTDRLNKMNEAAQHLLSIIDDVLDLSKIEAGKLVLEESDIDVGEIVDSVVEIAGDRAHSKRLQLAADCPPIPGRLVGDATRIRQALLNYVGNAIKFTRQGSIRIRVCQQEAGDESVVLRFEVSDTGIGIAADAVRRLFHSFEQADNSMTRQHGGSGLGLAIVKQIAGLMGGSVGVESSEGNGSTFWFTARLKKLLARKAGATLTHAAMAGETFERRHENRRILVVDDEPNNREVIVAILETVGMTADCATNGGEAVELTGKTHYDLILMDLQMPTMDGIEATRRIRRLPENAQTPILALTGNVVNEVREQCRNAGMNGFVAKPFSMNALLQAVTRWLRSPAPG